MRYAVTIVLVLVLLGLLGGVKAAQIGRLISSGKQAEQAGPPPEVVATARATESSWEGTISDIGSVTSSKGVTLANEAPGVVTRIHFESGNAVKKGDVLVELDARVEQSQLASALAREELAATTLRRSQALAASGAISPAELDADRTQLETAQKEVAGLRAQIAQKVIRAPFDGRLGIRRVNVGQYLGVGTPIAALETTKPLFVDFTTPQEQLADLAIGMPVRVGLAADGGAPRDGKIEAIEPAVDPATRAVRVRASIPNEDEALRPGMFVEVTVMLPRRRPVVVVPATAIVHASYGDSVFIVEDKPEGSPGMRTTPDGKPVFVARQQFVRTGELRGDFIAVTAGVTPGQRVVTAGAFKLRNGAPIVIDDDLQPKPQVAPRPQNR